MDDLSQEDIYALIVKYHRHDQDAFALLDSLSPMQLLRLFLIYHGMTPQQVYPTHTYCLLLDPMTQRKHFFLVPRPRSGSHAPRPAIHAANGHLVIDDLLTPITLQPLAPCSPYYYFHYDPNDDRDQRFRQVTLNLHPHCGQSCRICAGKETRRINQSSLVSVEPEQVFQEIEEKHPQAIEQLQVVAVVTGCFPTFKKLADHLSKVRAAASKRTRACVFRVLEHGVYQPAQLEHVVCHLGYDLFVTLETYDQRTRRRILGSKKGREVQQLCELVQWYAELVAARRQDEGNIVRVTYVVGLEALSRTEAFFEKLSAINHAFGQTVVAPWVSIFCPYSERQRQLLHPDFSLSFLIKAQQLCKEYFDPKLMAKNSGSTAQGHARGLF